MLNVLGAEAFTANAVKYSQTWVLFLSTCNENATTAHECLPKCWCSNKPVKIFYELTLPLCSTVLAQKIHPLRMIEKNLISACHPFHAVPSYNPSPPWLHTRCWLVFHNGFLIKKTPHKSALYFWHPFVQVQCSERTTRTVQFLLHLQTNWLGIPCKAHKP